MSKIVNSIIENMAYALEFLAIVAVVIVIAYIAEKMIQKKNGEKSQILTTRKVVMIGMFAAVSGILMLFEFNLPLIPEFYKLDFSELPVLICGFAFGPVAGVLTEFVKVLIKFIIKGTSTALVGELANFVVGSTFILPATIVYALKKNRKIAILGCSLGTIIMSVFGTIFNAVYLLPVFAELFHAPLDAFIQQGNALNANITNLTTFVCFAVAPLNIIKGTLDSIFTVVIYKRLSPIIKTAQITPKTNKQALEN